MCFLIHTINLVIHNYNWLKAMCQEFRDYNMPFPVLKLYWHFIGRSAGTNQGIKKYSVL